MEIWKPISGYEGQYEISNWGRIRSVTRVDSMGRTWSGQIIKTRPNRRGYYIVGLSSNSVHKTLSVSRLVATSFISNPDGLPCVNHIDEDKSNNRADNLEWCTYEYNINYGTRTKRAVSKLKKPVIATDRDGNETWYPSIDEATRELGGYRGHICRAINGDLVHACGEYTWKYAQMQEEQDDKERIHSNKK